MTFEPESNLHNRCKHNAVQRDGEPGKQTAKTPYSWILLRLAGFSCRYFWIRKVGRQM